MDSSTIRISWETLSKLKKIQLAYMESQKKRRLSCDDIIELLLQQDPFILSLCKNIQ